MNSITSIKTLEKTFVNNSQQSSDFLSHILSTNMRRNTIVHWDDKGINSLERRG